MPDRHLWTRHSTKLITFTGGVNAGDFDGTPTVIVFTITGRVLVHAVTQFCTVDLVSAGGGTLVYGVTGDTDAFIGTTTATDIDANEWWAAASPPANSGVTLADSVTGGITTSQRLKAVSGNMFLTIGTSDITGGAIVFDVLYTPLTDGGRLV